VCAYTTPRRPREDVQNDDDDDDDDDEDEDEDDDSDSDDDVIQLALRFNRRDDGLINIASSSLLLWELEEAIVLKTSAQSQQKSLLVE
jgi:hypothetical protein